jgi:hypothetical protein
LQQQQQPKTDQHELQHQPAQLQRQRNQQECEKKCQELQEQLGLLQQKVECQLAQLQTLEAELQERQRQARLSTRWTAVASDLVLTVPRGPLGNLAIAHLRENGDHDLGCQYQESLSERLSGLASSSVLSDLPYTFHRVRVQDGDERADANRLMQFHDGRRSDRGMVERVELNAILMARLPYLGLPFTLGGKNSDYLDQMNASPAKSGSASSR